MKYKYFSIKTIVYSAILLAILISLKFIEKVIPNLPNGLGDIAKLTEVFILIMAIAFPLRITLSVNLIYLLILTPIFPTIFASGTQWVNSFGSKVAVYLFDYFLPPIFIILISLFKNLKKWKIILISYLFSVFIILSHTTSGMVFFRQYVIDDYPNAKAPIFFIILGLNSLCYILYLLSLPILIPISFRLRRVWEKSNINSKYSN